MAPRVASCLFTFSMFTSIIEWNCLLNFVFDSVLIASWLKRFRFECYFEGGTGNSILLFKREMNEWMIRKIFIHRNDGVPVSLQEIRVEIRETESVLRVPVRCLKRKWTQDFDEKKNDSIISGLFWMCQANECGGERKEVESMIKTNWIELKIHLIFGHIFWCFFSRKFQSKNASISGKKIVVSFIHLIVMVMIGVLFRCQG